MTIRRVGVARQGLRHLTTRWCALQSCRLLASESPVVETARRQCTPHRTGPPWVLGPQDQGYGTVYTTECHVAGIQCIKSFV